MKIKVDFSDLFACAEEMGATIVKKNVITAPNASQGLDRPEWVPIKKEISIIDVGITEGLLSFVDERGVAQQVLLYIQDHGGAIENAILDISKRRKYHVADCSTLQTMKEEGRFERYVMTNDLNNKFLQIISVLPSLSDDNNISRLSNTYLNLLKGKEKAGLERAIISGILTAHRFSSHLYLQAISVLN